MQLAAALLVVASRDESAERLVMALNEQLATKLQDSLTDDGCKLTSNCRVETSALPQSALYDAQKSLF